MTTTIEKTDRAIKTDVLDELNFDPGVNVTNIGVLVSDGTVTLNGFVSNYGEKWEAVRAAKRVVGVQAIADDIEVRLADSHCRSDSDIAGAAANQISWSTVLPKDSVKVVVRQGWITLEGEVQTWRQKIAAGRIVHYLLGVKGVTNLVAIKPQVSSAVVENSIEAAFERSALLDAKKIHVETVQNNVVLSGSVRNYTELEDAERVAWCAPGVSSVDNQLKVQWSWFGGQ